jgi:hypothetical protein
LQLNDIVEGLDLPSPSKDKNGIGWLMIAFLWAFYYLYHQIPYEEAIKDILKKGGDTDTNAAIVGGLIGAWQGFTSIRKDWVTKVLSYTYEKSQGHFRPEWLIPSYHLVPLTKAILTNAPEMLKVKIGADEI